MNFTLDIDDEIVKRVEKVAAHKNTTLAAMVRDYLASVADAEETPALNTAAREEAVEKLRESWASLDSRDAAARNRDTTAGEEAAAKFMESVRQLSRPMGPRNWTRDDLYDRPYAYSKHRR